MTPEVVVKESINKLGRKSIVVSGFKNKLMVWFFRKFFSIEEYREDWGVE